MALGLPEELTVEIRQGRVNLFLGAGANHGSTQRNGDAIPQSQQLIKLVESKVGVTFDDDDKLPDVAGYLHTQKLTSQFYTLLQELFLGCKPSEELKRILSNFWPKIYSTNIDDAVDSIFSERRTPHSKFVLNAPIVDYQIADRSTSLIYLHGHAEKLEDGIIFSKRDYINTQLNITPWYDQLSSDLFLSKFIFVGTKLDEPVFDHVFERKRPSFDKVETVGYLVVPKLSAAKAAVLAENGIIHIPGTLADLADWLDLHFDKPVTANEVVESRYPELMALGKEQGDVLGLVNKLKDVTIVNDIKHSPAVYAPLQVRDFYRGSKPTWDDIVDGVQAELGHFAALDASIEALFTGSNRALVVLGPAGSGKSTTLKAAALRFARRTGQRTFSLDSSFPNFEETIKALSSVVSSAALVFYDGVDIISRDLSAIIDDKRYENIKFVFSERRNIWNERTSSAVRTGYGLFNIDRITEADASLIRDKLEKYGPFSKLARLKPEDQVARIYDRSQRQLLMGMMEATSERGFENIIRSDYASIIDPELKFLVILVALATIHRMGLPSPLAHAAFAYQFNRYPKAHHFNGLAGIVLSQRNELVARHPLYSQILLEQIAKPSEVQAALEALLLAFAKYGTPIPIRAKALGPLFTRLVRHRFVNAVLRNRRDLVIGLYERIEKAFSADGHFYLQYGLAHRAHREHAEAFSKIEASARIYDSFNARHALAKQRIILACLCPSRLTAEPLFLEAKKELEALDRADRSIGMYPLVTLAEGHLEYLSIFFGREETLKAADQYVIKINKKISSDPGNERLKKCRENINVIKNGGSIVAFDADDVV